MVSILRSDDVRKQNRMRVLAAVRRAGMASRTDIGGDTRLSAATISAITSDLLAEGVLMHSSADGADEFQPQVSSGRGRPKVALMVNPDAALVCTAYFHISSVSSAVADYAGNRLSSCSEPVKPASMTLDEIRICLINSVENALKAAHMKQSDLCRISIGFQGVANVDGSRILWTPICDQRNIPVQDWLQDYFGVPALVANDCDMIALALTWREPEKYGDNFAAVLLAHGVGMGLFLRKNIVNGTRSSAVEFGHMTYSPEGALCRCGNLGCIEAYAGDYAMDRMVKGEPENALPSGLFDPPDLDGIANAVVQGNKNAIRAVETAGSAIGTGLASLFALVDSFPVVFVGAGARLFPQMEPSIRKALTTVPGENSQQQISLDYIIDELPLVLEGCAASALLIQDDELATKRLQPEAAE